MRVTVPPTTDTTSPKASCLYCLWRLQRKIYTRLVPVKNTSTGMSSSRMEGSPEGLAWASTSTVAMMSSSSDTAALSRRAKRLSARASASLSAITSAISYLQVERMMSTSV